jgi:hypothetical protein
VDCGRIGYITAAGLSSVFSPSECLRLTNPVESNVTVSVALDAYALHQMSRNLRVGTGSRLPSLVSPIRCGFLRTPGKIQ